MLHPSREGMPCCELEASSTFKQVQDESEFEKLSVGGAAEVDLS